MESVIDEPDVSQALELVQHDILVSRAPQRVLDEARQAALALKDVISKKKRPFMLHGEQYLQFEDWQTLGRFYGVTSRVNRTAPVAFGEAHGFEASADAVRADGMVISSADAMCLDDEQNWRGKPAYQLRSMAQTRACAKSLRNVLAWVVVLAGYNPTPAEEMGSTENGITKTATNEVQCPECGGPTWDNRESKRNPRAPDYKCKNKSCNGAIWNKPEKNPDDPNGNDPELREALFDQAERFLIHRGDSEEKRKAALGRLVALSTDKMAEAVDKLVSSHSTDPKEEGERLKQIAKIEAEFDTNVIQEELQKNYRGKKLGELSLDALTQIYADLIPF